MTMPINLEEMRKASSSLDVIAHDEFQLELQNVYHAGDGMTYMEAILDYCTDKGLDEEDIKDMVGPGLQAQLYVEASRMGLIKNPNISSAFGDMWG